jgi:hypothetical protein
MLTLISLTGITPCLDDFVGGEVRRLPHMNRVYLLRAELESLESDGTASTHKK